MRGRQWTLGFGWLAGYKAFLTIYLCTSEAWRPSGVQVRCIASERRGDVIDGASNSVSAPKRRSTLSMPDT
jgi:hypothetical protein